MASAQITVGKEIDGINLDDYFLQRRTYGSAVYVHKKFLNNSEGQNNVQPKVVKKEGSKNNKRDKGQQFEGIPNYNIIFSNEKPENVHSRNDSVMDQTVKFAKKLIPLVIPPSRDKSPTEVYYTIKPSKKSKRKAEKHHKVDNNFTENVKRSKTQTAEIYRKVNKESVSLQESITSSSNNTFDDINNRSLCCTLSESSEKMKKVNKKRTEAQKCVITESFEALAAELNGNGIKVHLMTDQDKKMLTDSLKVPIINAIKDFITQYNTANTRTEKLAYDNSRKLDEILDKLHSIESKLEAQTEIRSSKTKAVKISKLEQLGEDLVEENDSEEELLCNIEQKHNAVIEFLNGPETSNENLGCGEVPVKATTSVGVRANRSARLPARFCWTDAAGKN